MSNDQWATETQSDAAPQPAVHETSRCGGTGGGTSRGAITVPVLVALAALSLAGCGGGTPSNGLEDKSAAQVLQDAAAAIKGANGVHVAGTGIADGMPTQIDLRIEDGSSGGTITLGDAHFEITRVDDDAYVKGDEDALEALGVQPEMHHLGANRWLKLGPEELSGLEGFSLDSFARQLTANESPLETEVEQTEFDGRRVVVISKQDGSRLYIANTGPAYPLRAESKGASAGRIDFTEYDADFQITPPADYVELGELAWLDAIAKLHTKIDEPFMASEINLTRATMVSLGSALGECTRELARIGSPTERLQPVHALVAQACAQYDEGAQCFDTAASVSDQSGAVVMGTPEEQTQTGGIDCGFAAQGDGGNLLAQAEAKGNEITSTPAG
jgi:hypothetical protein